MHVLVLAVALATSPPMIEKAAPNVNVTPTAAPLLNRAAPGPRASNAGRRSVRAFTSAASKPSNVVVPTRGSHGSGWGALGIIGIIGLVGLWRRWTFGP